MKYLVDANLSRHIAGMLCDAGFEADHVIGTDLWNADDETISDFAIANGQTVISADSDFATILHCATASHRRWSCCDPWTGLPPTEQAAILIANLAAVEPELAQGAVVSIGTGHVRVRRLPLK